MSFGSLWNFPRSIKFGVYCPFWSEKRRWSVTLYWFCCQCCSCWWRCTPIQCMPLFLKLVVVKWNKHTTDVPLNVLQGRWVSMYLVHFQRQTRIWLNQDAKSWTIRRNLNVCPLKWKLKSNDLLMVLFVLLLNRLPMFLKFFVTYFGQRNTLPKAGLKEKIKCPLLLLFKSYSWQLSRSTFLLTIYAFFSCFYVF